jgi:hypothetical protein
VDTTRRFAAALREARWGHVLLELALVVAGILIALAIDGWLDSRRDARLERHYLLLLTRDLDRDLVTLDEILRFEHAQVETAALAYRAVRAGGAGQDREAVARALNELTARRTLRLARATYTDLLSTGNLRLIRNADLRDRIVRLYEANERAQTIRDRNNESSVDRQYVTFLLDHGYVAPRPARELPTIASADQKFAARAPVPTDSNSDPLWRLPANSKEWGVLAGHVWYRGLMSEGAIETSEQIVEETKAVKADILKELAARHWP